jgi:hypothetical protein
MRALYLILRQEPPKLKEKWCAGYDCCCCRAKQGLRVKKKKV